MTQYQSNEHQSDEQLMTCVARGDRAAYTALTQRHLDRVYRIARSTLPRASDAEDAAQDVFTRVWIYAPRWQAGRASFSTWIYRVTMNCCYDALRKNKAGRRQEPVDETLPAGGADAETLLATAQDNERLARAVRALPDRQRLAITLCYFEGLTGKGAAQTMKMNEKALDGLLVRARRTLKAALTAGKDGDDG